MCLFSWFPFYYKRTDQGSENLLSNMRHTMFVNIYLKLTMEKKKKNRPTSFSGMQFILSSKYTYLDAKRRKAAVQIILEYFALQNRLKIRIIFKGVHQNVIDIQSVRNSFFLHLHLHSISFFLVLLLIHFLC